MSWCGRRRSICALLVALVVAGSSLAQSPAGDRLPEALVRRLSHVQLSGQQLQLLVAGEVVVAGLEGSAEHEAGGVAIVRVPAEVAALLSGGLDEDWLVEASEASAFAWLPDLPKPEQLARVDLIEQDYRDLRGCRPGSCKVKLPVRLILAIRSGVQWREAGAREAAARLVFDELARRAAAYQRAGDAALGWADDKRRRVSLRDEVHGVVAGAESFARTFPELHAYLLRYPEAPLRRVWSRLFVMRTTMGAGKEVVSLQHALAQQRADPELPVVWVTKQLYASHYLEAALGLTYPVVDPARGTYLVHEFRVRLDILRGWGLFHGRVRRGIREVLATRLGKVRDRLVAAAGTR